MTVLPPSAVYPQPHLPGDCGSLFNPEGRAGRQSESRKEAGRVVGGHCDGGAEGTRAIGPVVNVTALQALSQPSEVSSPHPRRTGSPSLTEDLARRDGSRSGPQPPAAGGGIIAASAARTIVSQKKTGPDALNVWA